MQLVRGIPLDGTGLPMLQMAYLTLNDSDNDNKPPNREEVIPLAQRWGWSLDLCVPVV